MTHVRFDARHDTALAALRVAIGGIFAAHGAQKLFIYGIEGVTGAFGGMGIPMPGLVGPLTGVIELVAGIALVAGLMTRLAGLGLALVMLGAIGFVHIRAGFWAPNGVEFPLALLAGAAVLALSGGGRYSLDALRATRRASR